MGYMAQIATNVIYVKVLVIVVEICTIFKYNSNMQICERSWLYIYIFKETYTNKLDFRTQYQLIFYKKICYNSLIAVIRV